MVAHEKRNSAQLFCAVPTRNDLALSSLLFSDHPTQNFGYPMRTGSPSARMPSPSGRGRSMTPSTTLDIYTHAFDKNKKAASAGLQEMLEI